MPEGLMDTGSRIVAAFEAAWCSIQVRHPQVPDVVMITGPQRRGKGDEALGYHAPDRWQLAAEARSQVDLFIAGELLAKDPREIHHTHSCTRPPTRWPTPAGSRTPPGRAATTNRQPHDHIILG
jgi:hypothetical protein